eukprot:TRINITY_DN16244_c0_g1_i1.p3 TRINITY_DN16244_c0_g1~~TRINITY_DN16244_c0_g1_i1.p3  ORF type:complete len:163 (-),score=63.87 TRINITY_DN16244_c0_g1_i1:1333-1821(-)
MELRDNGVSLWEEEVEEEWEEDVEEEEDGGEESEEGEDLEMETDEEYIQRLRSEFNENQLILFELLFEDEDLLDEECVDELMDLVINLERSWTLLIGLIVDLGVDHYVPLLFKKFLKLVFPFYNPLKYLSIGSLVRAVEARRYHLERRKNIIGEWKHLAAVN